MQVPCPLASKFHVCFNKIRTTSELLVRQSMRISTALSALLYNSPGWTFLLRFVHKSLCDAGQSELLDTVLQFFSKLDSNGIADTLCRRSPFAMIFGQVISPLPGCDPMFWQLPQNYSVSLVRSFSIFPMHERTLSPRSQFSFLVKENGGGCQ